MKKALVFSLIMLATPVYSQQVAPVEFNLKLTSQEVDILGEALGTLPYSKVAVLIQKIRQQIVEQQQPKVEPPK